MFVYHRHNRSDQNHILRHRKHHIAGKTQTTDEIYKGLNKTKHNIPRQSDPPRNRQPLLLVVVNWKGHMVIATKVITHHSRTGLRVNCPPRPQKHALGFRHMRIIAIHDQGMQY